MRERNQDIDEEKERRGKEEEVEIGEGAERDGGRWGKRESKIKNEMMRN